MNNTDKVIIYVSAFLLLFFGLPSFFSFITFVTFSIARWIG